MSRRLMLIIQLAAMVAVLALAYGLQRGIVALRALTSRTFRYATLGMWLSSASDLLLAGALLGFWRLPGLVDERSALVDLLFVAAGLLSAFAWRLLWGPLRLPLQVSIGTSRSLLPDSRVGYAGAFIAVVGAWGLIARARKGF